MLTRRYIAYALSGDLIQHPIEVKKPTKFNKHGNTNELQ